MLVYQKVVILFLGIFILSILVNGLIESAIKKHKAKKEAISKLEKENQQLKDKLYTLKFQAELRGLKLDV